MRRHPGETLWATAVWAVVVFFVVNLLAMIGAVAVNSFGTHWFNSWLPAGFTTQWYSLAWNEFQLPAIPYGIPLATVLYQAHLAGAISGVILANLVPSVPFVILIMIPFVEQIDPRVEAAARVFGAGMGRLFVQVLVPLLTPGILAALLLVLVRTIAMFELT